MTGPEERDEPSSQAEAPLAAVKRLIAAELLHSFPVAPNLLDQDFTASGPNEKWGADISYVRTKEGWLYLAVVIDLFARRVVGWASSDRLRKELPLAALRRALLMRRPPNG